MARYGGTPDQVPHSYPTSIQVQNILLAAVQMLPVYEKIIIIIINEMKSL